MSASDTSLLDPGVATREAFAQNRAPLSASGRVAVAAVLLGLMMVGGFFRMANLGELGAQVDEGFQSLAVAGILEHGYPKLDTGLVYARSPLFLYAQAAAVAVFGPSEWALRLPAAVFGLLCIPAAYLLGRHLFQPWSFKEASALRFHGVAVGLALATMMAFSTWEIEYARYGRFYTLFQLLYMLGVVAFMDGYLRNQFASKAVFWLLFLLVVSVHDLGVMLGLCFWVVIPLHGYPWKHKAKAFALSGLCGVLWVGYTKLWRGLAASWSDAVPDTNATGLAEVQVRGDGFFSSLVAKIAGMLPGLNLPDFRLLEGVWADQRWVIGLIALPAVVATVLLVSSKLRELAERKGGTGTTAHHDGATTGRLWLPLLLTAVWAAALQQFALAGVAMLVYAAFFVRSWKHWLRRSELVAVVACGISAAMWVLYFWSSDSVSKHVWVPAVTNLPAVHTYFLQWFVPGWKRMLVLLVPATYLVARRAAHGTHTHGRSNGAWLLLFAIAVPILVTSELRWQFSESRYFFHLYPLILAVLALGVVTAGTWVAQRTTRSLATVAVVLALGATMAVTKDLNPAKAYAVTTRTHASTKDPIRSVINFSFYAGWPQDQKTATLAAVDQISEGDKVLVVGPVHIAANYRHYLGRIDYIASSLPIYNSVKADGHGRWIDLATGGEVISTSARLREMVESVEGDGGALWVFSDTVMTSPENWYLSDAEPGLKEGVAALTVSAMLTGKDGRTTVSRVAFPATQLAEVR